MWSYLTASSLINPLPGYVENKAGAPKSLKARRNDPSALLADSGYTVHGCFSLAERSERSVTPGGGPGGAIMLAN
jgi:hypothetical protein